MREGRYAMQLYIASTFYQLLNVIHMKYRLFPNEKADLLLMDSTDFSKQIQALKHMDIFEDIYDAKGSWNLDRCFIRGSAAEKRQVFNKFARDDSLSFTKKQYTDCFLGAQTPYFKMVYYALCEAGIAPRAHLFEDGIYTYVLDFLSECNQDGMDHNQYREQDIRKKIENIFAYGDNSMYFGSKKLNYVQIPNMLSDTECLAAEMKIYTKLWAKPAMPKEKYIFLEEGMFQDRLVSSDIVLLDAVAEIVGKENIIVKRHPRCTYDRFSVRGYKVMEDSSYPWEISLMDENADQHVLLSLSSTATTTGKLVLGKDIPAVQLYSIMPYGCAGPHCSRKTFPNYANSLYSYMNRDNRVLYVPKSHNELREILLYLDAGY